MSVQNMQNERGNKVANQYVIETRVNNRPCITFKSYDSYIAEWCGGNLRLSEDWNYSMTTLKYLALFINTYTMYNVSGKNDIQGLINAGFATVDLPVTD